MIGFKPIDPVLEYRKKLTLAQPQMERNYDRSLGFICRGLFNPAYHDSFLQDVPKNIMVVTETSKMNLKKWKSRLKSPFEPGEVLWSLYPESDSTFYERLDIYEGGDVVRSIMVIRDIDSNSILGIVDIKI